MCNRRTDSDESNKSNSSRRDLVVARDEGQVALAAPRKNASTLFYARRVARLLSNGQWARPAHLVIPAPFPRTSLCRFLCIARHLPLQNRMEAYLIDAG